MHKFTTALPQFRARSFSTIRPVIYFAVMASSLIAGYANAKTPGSTYCFYKTCHRVKTLAETRALIGQDHTLPASFYDDCKADRYNPCGLTSSGEVFRPNAADNAASSIYPDGTKLLVWSSQSGQALVLRINNAGPYWGNRTLDVSRAAAEKLGFKKQGVASLKARILDAPTRSEATYKKGRTYAPVAGDIGRYLSASAAVAAITSMQMIATAALAPFNGRTLPAGLITGDEIPSSTVAVAALVPAPKMPAELVADASALVSLRWPVVHEAAVHSPVAREKVASLDLGQPEKAAGQYQSKHGVSWSQRVINARLRDAAVDRADRPATIKAAPVRKVEPAKPSTRAVSKPSTVRRTEIARLASKPAKPTAKVLVERDAPHDISVFSRYNPDAPKAKQAANKSGLLRTSVIKTTAAARS